MKFKENCFRCFSALSVKNRVEIVKLLQASDKLSVLEIAKHFKITQPTVTHHLKYLEMAGILKSKKQGKKVYYYLSPICSSDCAIFS